MRNCGQCRHAKKAREGAAGEGMKGPDKPLFCGLHEVDVRAGAERCDHFAISAFAYLERVARGTEHKEHLAALARRYREIAKQSTATMEAVRVGGTTARSKVETNVSKAIDIAQGIEAQAAAQKERILTALDMIGEITTPERREVLMMRHMQRREWAFIASRLHCDERSAQRYHKEALKEYEALMENRGIIE